MIKFQPTDTPVGSEARITTYCARYDKIESEGHRPDLSTGSDLPSIFVQGDDNLSPAELKPGTRPGYSLNATNEDRVNITPCSFDFGDRFNLDDPDLYSFSLSD